MNEYDFLNYNPKKRFIEKVLGPSFNLLIDHHISPAIIGLLFLLIMCKFFLPRLKNKDGRYKDHGVLLIAVTVLVFLVFVYTQIQMIMDLNN